ncbi:hypothetical protein C9J03_00875 [Photobacterium gaetbulicola]|uniref:Putative Signal transduction histidine kinase n=1 Tax=Photobacterium gaetbulicola Gung47 TaxID=658445 RepID=A0A0C5WRV4_9GAMM|nr:type II secretion system protein [Photobacterium gaetbulicola]AJR05695.1 putative Signal transduction histidine kinase [Photobacterium gaetbulicola Gung47]PSU14664.1 hypothetical protein C9J03_00875 [Photobacterium gaetbulicola]
MIRLVTVIVLVGLLALTAAVKMLNIQQDSRRATLQSIAANIHTMSELVHTKAEIGGALSKCYPDSSEELSKALENKKDSFFLEDIYICNGYPSGHIDNVRRAFDIDAKLYVTNKSNDNGGLTAHISFPKNGVLNYQCRVIYTDAKGTDSYQVEFIDSDC